MVARCMKDMFLSIVGDCKVPEKSLFETRSKKIHGQNKNTTFPNKTRTSKTYLRRLFFVVLCNVDHQVRPYIGDDEGRSGLCSDQSMLGSGTFADLFGCADLCALEVTTKSEKKHGNRIPIR